MNGPLVPHIIRLTQEKKFHPEAGAPELTHDAD
jgi:hypothetical protein